MPEKDQPKDTIKVKLGEPFSVIPNFANLPDIEPGDTTLVNTVVVEIEGFGKANINFRIDAAFDDQGAPVETPAGPVNVIKILDNNSVNFDKRTFPVIVDVEVYGSLKENLSGSKCEMQVGEHKYQGELLVDEVTLVREPRQFADAACFLRWNKLGTNIFPEVYFPQQPAVFEGVKFTIS